MVRGLLVVVAAAMACTPARVQFFAPMTPNEVVVRAVRDTVFVQQMSPDDSTVADAVILAFDMLDEAERTNRPQIASVLRTVLDAVPEEARVRGERPGEEYGSVARRVQGQGPAEQFTLFRADRVVVHDIVADTIEHEEPPPDDDPLADPVVHRWLVLVLSGEAVLDSTFGRRPGR